MNWRLKAFVQNLAARLPAGLSYPAYYRIQRIFGGLRRIDPIPDLRKAAEIVRAVQLQKRDVAGKAVLEIGTGRMLNLPIGLFLCGATKIHTVDLNPYLKPELVRESIAAMKREPERIRESFAELANATDLRERLELLFGIKDFSALQELLDLEYRAPGDAGALDMLENASIDIHYSTNVFEHVSPDDLRRIVREARRVLQPGGLFVHRVDLADHFTASDPSITSINFLQFSEPEWEDLAGNRFMYHNRLRSYELYQLFGEEGLDIVWKEETVDPKALSLLQSGFRVDRRFMGQDPEKLATTFVKLVGVFP